MYPLKSTPSYPYSTAFSIIVVISHCGQPNVVNANFILISLSFNVNKNNLLSKLHKPTDTSTNHKLFILRIYSIAVVDNLLQSVLFFVEYIYYNERRFQTLIHKLPFQSFYQGPFLVNISHGSSGTP